MKNIYDFKMNLLSKFSQYAKKHVNPTVNLTHKVEELYNVYCFFIAISIEKFLLLNL